VTSEASTKTVNFETITSATTVILLVLTRMKDSAATDPYENGQPVPVTVDKTNPVDVSGRYVAARDIDDTPRPPLEKAVAAKFGGGTYEGLNVPYFPHEAMEILTGRKGEWKSPANMTPNEVRELIGNGHPVCADSISDNRLSEEARLERRGPNGGNLAKIPKLAPHSYTVRSVGEDGQIELHNPHGYDHLNLTWEQFVQHFDYVGWC
jgi:hypothetical protein